MSRKVMRNPKINYLKITYNAHNSVYKYIYSFNELIWVDNTTHKSQRPSKKKPQYQTWESFFWVVGQGCQKTSRTYSLLAFPTRGPYYCALQKQDPEVPGLALLSMSPPWGLASMVPEGATATFQRREAASNSTQLWCPNDRDDMITLWVQWLPGYPHSNQQLCNWT